MSSDLISLKGSVWLKRAALIAAGVVIGWKLHVFIQQDRCLDGGGVWEGETQVCDKC